MIDVDRHVEAMIDAAPEAVVAAYRRKFAIAAATAVSAAMIRQHWRRERQGARAILAAPPGARAAVADRAYTAVFGECPWLNEADGDARDPDRAFSHFAILLNGARRVYEVGSGKGALIGWLAARGFDCVGTEITPERGATHGVRAPNLEWHATDGVDLARHETPGTFDAVLSNQVLEHLHPDDVAAHFAGAAALLKPGGRYVLATPHRLSGPADLSAVFGLDRPVCFHLKEYGYNELVPVLRRAGFTRLRAVYTTPQRLKRVVDVCWSSGLYLGLLRAAEHALDRLPRRLAHRLVGLLHKLALWRPDVFVVAEKP